MVVGAMKKAPQKDDNKLAKKRSTEAAKEALQSRTRFVDDGLKLFDLNMFSDRWEVPWGGWKVALGTGAWSFSFIFTAAVIVPLLSLSQGYDPKTFTTDQKIGYLLLIQVSYCSTVLRTNVAHH